MSIDYKERIRRLLDAVSSSIRTDKKYLGGKIIVYASDDVIENLWIIDEDTETVVDYNNENLEPIEKTFKKFYEEYEYLTETEETTDKEFVWELYGYSGSIYAKDYEEARRILNQELSIQEVEE